MTACCRPAAPRRGEIVTLLARFEAAIQDVSRDSPWTRPQLPMSGAGV
jgi:hypothetical protein